MGNQPSTVPQNCGVECHKQQRIDDAHAEYIRLNSDPQTSKTKVAEAWSAYQSALHGPGWEFQQNLKNQPSKATLSREDLQIQLQKMEEALESLDGQTLF